MIKKQQGLLAIGLSLLLIVIDQLIKIYIKTHFCLRESVEVTSWFYLTFIENNGMAYGMAFVDKYVLTAFRIIMTGVFGWVLYRAIDRRLVSTAFVVVVSMILAGAAGNIIDCIFYGQWFTDSYGHVAQWVDESAGLMPSADWFRGPVVDMFYFPLWHWPDWMPLIGGNVFFSPVFNFADACISVGVVLLICFFRNDFANLGKVTE